MLKVVTITGADNSIKPEQLINLSKDYPFVEWAILFSRSQQGGRRFPSLTWVNDLVNLKIDVMPQMALSMHLCGAYVREFLVGNIDFISSELSGAWPHFNRVQINTHGEQHKIDAVKLIEAMNIWPEKEFIFQYDNVKVHSLALELAVANKANCSALFDLSHGAGLLPEAWPEPLYGVKCGYAGGISPDNIQEQIKAVEEQADELETWIDMETHVRSDQDRLFDINKVDSCLRQASPFVK